MYKAGLTRCLRRFVPHCPCRAEVISVQKASWDNRSAASFGMKFHIASGGYLFGLLIRYFFSKIGKMYFQIHLIKQESDFYSFFHSDRRTFRSTERYSIRKLSLFGSVLRDDFTSVYNRNKIGVVGAGSRRYP